MGGIEPFDLPGASPGVPVIAAISAWCPLNCKMAGLYNILLSNAYKL